MDQKTDIVSPRQLALALDSLPLRGLAAVERDKAVSLLAQLLLEAIGPTEGGRDDEHV